MKISIATSGSTWTTLRKASTGRPMIASTLALYSSSKRFLVQGAGAADVLGLTGPDQGPLARGVDVAEHADHRLVVDEALRRARAAAEVLAVQGDHRVGELDQGLASSGCLFSGHRLLTVAVLFRNAS